MDINVTRRQSLTLAWDNQIPCSCMVNASQVNFSHLSPELQLDNTNFKDCSILVQYYQVIIFTSSPCQCKQLHIALQGVTKAKEHTKTHPLMISPQLIVLVGQTHAMHTHTLYGEGVTTKPSQAFAWVIRTNHRHS